MSPDTVLCPKTSRRVMPSVVCVQCQEIGACVTGQGATAPTRGGTPAETKPGNEGKYRPEPRHCTKCDGYGEINLSSPEVGLTSLNKICPACNGKGEV